MRIATLKTVVSAVLSRKDVEANELIVLTNGRFNSDDDVDAWQPGDVAVEAFLNSVLCAKTIAINVAGDVARAREYIHTHPIGLCLWGFLLPMPKGGG